MTKSDDIRDQLLRARQAEQTHSPQHIRSLAARRNQRGRILKKKKESCQAFNPTKSFLLLCDNR
jgi:hypothetical protein